MVADDDAAALGSGDGRVEQGALEHPVVLAMAADDADRDLAALLAVDRGRIGEFEATGPAGGQRRQPAIAGAELELLLAVGRVIRLGVAGKYAFEVDDL